MIDEIRNLTRKHIPANGLLAGYSTWGRVRLLTLGTIALCLLLIALSPLRIGIVLGESMTPTLQPNHPFLLDRSYYKHHAPARGEVVVFKKQGMAMVKRVAAGPGDDLWLLVRPPGHPNGEEVVYPEELEHIRRLVFWHPEAGCLRHVAMPSGSMFVVGDAESISIDSRHFGPVLVDEIVGRVLMPVAKAPAQDRRGTWPASVRS